MPILIGPSEVFFFRVIDGAIVISQFFSCHSSLAERVSLLNDDFIGFVIAISFAGLVYLGESQLCKLSDYFQERPDIKQKIEDAHGREIAQSISAEWEMPSYKYYNQLALVAKAATTVACMCIFGFSYIQVASLALQSISIAQNYTHQWVKCTRTDLGNSVTNASILFPLISQIFVNNTCLIC